MSTDQSSDSAQREEGLRRGRRLEIFTVAWNVVEAIVAVVAGWLAGSIALVGFGFDSMIEVASRKEVRSGPVRFLGGLGEWSLLHGAG